MKISVPAPARRHVIPWAIAITVAGFVTGGGIAAAVTMGGNSAAPAQTGQADLTTLLAASANGPANATTLKPERAFSRLRRAGGIYGTITYRGKDGVDHTLAFERGTIESVANNQVVVRAPDGTTMTWLIVSSTVVRQNRAKTTTAALHDGELVFTGGPVVNGAKDARLIVIRTTTGAVRAVRTVRAES